MDESGIEEAESSRKGVSGSRVVGAIRSLVNARSLQLESSRVLHESLLVPILMYGSEKGSSRIRVAQMDYLRGLLGIRGMNKVPNSRIRKLCSDEGCG